MIKSYSQAVKFLESYIPTPEKKHPGELGLRRMEKLAEFLGNPQLSYPTIHVGGTSGKGSTATFVASILSTKYKVGLHTSPHLMKINERIKILDNIKNQISKIKNTDKKSNIRDDIFIELLNSVIPVIKTIEKSELGRPSYFEIVTAMAFLYFKKQKIDIAVIEVGMGGRFDATNVIKPEVAVITNVGLDHTEVLGETVEKIAEDKAGIIKPNIQVVTGVKQKSVISIVKAKGKRQKAKVRILGKDFRYKIKKVDDNGCVFDYFGEKTYRDLKISLLGRHQVENSSIALKAIEEIPNSKFQIPNYDIRKGLISAYIPGRLEVVSKKPLVILDGAHNPEKMRATVSAIKEIFPKKKIKAIIAIKSGKDARGILDEILPICKRIVFTKFRLTTDLGDTYSYTPAKLRKIAKEIGLPKSKGSTDLTLITGSLYLVGDVKKYY